MSWILDLRNLVCARKAFKSSYHGCTPILRVQLQAYLLASLQLKDEGDPSVKYIIEEVESELDLVNLS